MEVYSKGLKNLIDAWVGMATTKNLSGNGTKDQVMTFNLYQNIDLIRFSIVQQALKEGLIDHHTPDVLTDIEEQIRIVADVVYRIRGNNYTD